jgi:DNA (cytosine-5)-methyltransferase 1
MPARSPKPSLSNHSVVDVFAGAGGLSEGFRQAGYTILAGSDVDPDAMATFRDNFTDASAIIGDIRQPSIREQVVSAAREATVVVGGPPCQAFSQVRNHSRVIDDPRNSLYREFVLVLGETLPPAFVMENVTGMDQMGVREQIIFDLSLEGEYEVLPQVLDAADFGVPQTRKRLIFVGVHASLLTAPPVVRGSGATDAAALVRVPGSTQSRYDVAYQLGLLSQPIESALTDSENVDAVTVRDALSDLAALPMGRRSDVISYDQLSHAQSAYQRKMRANAGPLLSNVQVPRINEDTALRLARIPQGGNHRDLPDALLERYLTGQRWGQDNGSGLLSRRHYYAYRRLHPDIWAWTLNTKADSVYHYESARSLSVREFARLQSFPDRFVFTTDKRRGDIPGRIRGGAAHSRYRQVGNAVPPLLARAVASALLPALAQDSLFCAPSVKSA